jgi:hypothetical protein
MRWIGLVWVIGVFLVSMSGRGSADDLPDVAAHAPWTLHERSEDPENGWVLYRREVRGSEFAAFRLEAEISSEPAIVAAAAHQNLTDPDVRRKNMTKTVLRDDARETIIYSYIDMPLVSDRDVTTRTVWSRDPGRDRYLMEWQASEEGPAPKKGVVRLRTSSGSWLFTPVAGGTRAVYESHTDIGGVLPGWLVNGMMLDTVVDGIVNLRARVAQDFD